MKVLLTSAVALLCFTVISCSKHSTGPSPGAGPNSLFPLKPGNIWYYADSAYSDSVLTAAYLDTMYSTSKAYQDNTGTIYFELNDTYGWFFGSYVSVDPSNTAIYEVDSPYYQPYTFFAVPQQDGAQIGTGVDNSNPSCPFYTVQYGYLGPYNINGFSCMANVEYTTDCNNNPQEEIDSYVAAGTGVVRIEHYLPDSATGPLHMDYSQTLLSATIKK
jgi:hypothetical protein